MPKAPPRTNFARASIWGRDMKMECSGTIGDIAENAFRMLPNKAARERVLKELQEIHEARNLLEEKEAACQAQVAGTHQIKEG